MEILTLAALIGARAPVSTVQPSNSVVGWWRATIKHNGSTDELYLHLQSRGDANLAFFSAPSVGTSDTAVGSFLATASQVKLVDVGWTLERSRDGTLRGVLPNALVPVYDIEAIFHRSGTPRQLMTAPVRPVPEAPLWRREMGAAIFGDIAYDPRSHRIIVGTVAGALKSLDARTGETAWSITLASPIRSAPLVANGAILVSTDSDALKLDAQAGRIQWSASLGKAMHPILPITDSKSRWDHYSATPLVRAGIVYVGSRDGCVHALSLATGTKVRDYCSSDEVTGRPIVDDTNIYFASFDGSVYAARLSDGNLLWKHDTHGAISRDLGVAGNSILAGSRSYDLVAIDKRSGRPLWTHYDWWSWIDSPPEVHGNELLVGSSDSQRVYCLSAVNGHTIWATFLGGWAWTKPSLSKTLVYAGFIGTTMPYVGKRAGGLAALDAKTGRIKWMLSSKPRADSPIYGFAAAPLVASGRVYAADLNGSVSAYPAK